MKVELNTRHGPYRIVLPDEEEVAPYLGLEVAVRDLDGFLGPVGRPRTYRGLVERLQGHIRDWVDHTDPEYTPDFDPWLQEVFGVHEHPELVFLKEEGEETAFPLYFHPLPTLSRPIRLEAEARGERFVLSGCFPYIPGRLHAIGYRGENQAGEEERRLLFKDAIILPGDVVITGSGKRLALEQVLQEVLERWADHATSLSARYNMLPLEVGVWEKTYHASPSFPIWSFLGGGGA